MPAGTIALTNNSTTVTGSGTAFNTELKANDFIVVVVGGVTYTLGVQSVNSATSVTLVSAYGGPAISGTAWTAVPNAALIGITAQVAADVAKAIRGLNQDKVNWQQVFSAAGNITVNLPDGSSFTGPSWNYMVTQFGSKLDKAGGTMTGGLTLPGIEISAGNPYIDFHFNNSSADYSVRLINTASSVLELSALGGSASLYVNGGIRVGNPVLPGGINIFRGNGIESALWGINCNDGSLTFVRGTGANATVNLSLSTLAGCRGINGLQGQNGAAFGQPYNWYWNGSGLEAWVGSTQVGSLTGNATSDKGLKKDIRYETDSEANLEEVLQWRPATFKMKERGIIPESADTLGFIANDLVVASPECVNGKGLPDDYDILDDPNNPHAYSLNVIAMVAKLTHAIQAQQQQILSRDSAIEELQKRLKALDGLDA